MKKNILFISAVGIFILFSCSKLNEQRTEESVMQKVGNSKQGVIYTESNDATQNSIIAYFQNSNGTLTYLSTTASGGTGTGAALGAKGALALDETHHWLYAVNAGSNSISVFTINEDGTLSLTQTISSNGTKPVSLAVFGWWLYVANSVSANISGFSINNTNGTLTPMAGSSQALSNSSALPGMLSFTPDRHLIATEKASNRITTFAITTAGMSGPGSWISSVGATPYGFAVAGNHIIVAEANGGTANAGTVSSYLVGSYGTGSGTPTPGSGGSMSVAAGPVCCQQSMNTAVATTSDGHYAYVINTGSNTISSFSVGNDGSLTVINNVEANTGNGPSEIAFSRLENFLYVLNSNSHTISELKKSPNARLNSVGEIGGLPAYAAGLVAL